MPNKKFKLSENEIKGIISDAGSCVASDKITVDGLPVGYMYRESPDFETDSGWRFFSGTEDQDYVDNPDNCMIYDLNTIANCDPSIVPYLSLETGSELERRKEGLFRSLLHSFCAF